MSNDYEEGIDHQVHERHERGTMKKTILKVVALLVIGGILTEAAECTGVPQRVVYDVREGVGSTLKNLGEGIQPDVVPKLSQTPTPIPTIQIGPSW